MIVSIITMLEDEDEYESLLFLCFMVFVRLSYSEMRLNSDSVAENMQLYFEHSWNIIKYIYTYTYTYKSSYT